MKRLFLFLLAGVAALAQTAVFPGAIATDSQLMKLANRVQSNATVAVTPSDTVVHVVSGSRFLYPGLITLDSEILAVCSISGNDLTVGSSSCPNVDGRGFDGSAAASHVINSAVTMYVDAWHHMAVTAEIKAIETALGINLANVSALFPSPVPVNKGGTNATTAAGARTNLGTAASGANADITSLSSLSTPLSVAQGGTATASVTGVLVGNATSAFAGVTGTPRQQLRVKPNFTGTIYEFATPSTYPTVDYNFPAQLPGGSLIAGGVGQAITLTPCPLGVAGADVAHYVYLSGGTGTAEKMLLTGGTCTSGAATGTIIGTPANAHSGSWTVTSAAFGWQEAVNVACAAGGGTVVLPPGNSTPHATVTVASSCAGLEISGSAGTGISSTIIYRTEDYGSTLVAGTPTTGIAGLLVRNLKFSHYINFTAAPAPGTIINRPTTGAHVVLYGPNTARFENVRFENMPNNVVANGGADVLFDNCQFWGIWDPATAGLQVTNASLQINYVAALGIPSYYKLRNSQFYGYGSLSVGKTNIGPKYMVQVNGVEDMEIDGGAMGGASIANVGMFPSSTSNILAMVRIRGVKFDSAQTAEILISGDGNLSASDIVIGNNVFNGENQSDYAVSVTNPGAGSPSSSGVNITGNEFLAYLATPLHLLDGVGFGIFGNTIRYYNSANTYATAENASAIYVGGRANDYLISSNMVGGGQTYSAYGAGGNYCLNGIQIAAPTAANANGRLWGNYPPYYSALGNLTDPVFSTKMLSYPDETIKVSSENAVATAVSLSALNNAESANIPLEVRATKTVFPVGPISATGLNYIASETGANNAIAGCLTNIPLTNGLKVTQKLGHTLQAGADTYNYCAGGAVALKSARNPANNIGTAYAATGSITMTYDSTGPYWLDVSQ